MKQILRTSGIRLQAPAARCSRPSADWQGTHMKTAKKQHQGFSLRTFYLWMVILAIAMTIIMVYSTYHLTESFLNLSETTDSHIEMEKAANELMDASDYLTEKAQRFAGTGNMQFVEDYFVEAEQSARREKALDKMKDAPAYKTAYQYLQTAMDASLELMNLEYYGMKLVMEAKGYEYYPDALKNVELTKEDAALSAEEKMHRATYLLLSDDYYDLKSVIRTNMRHSLKEIENMTRRGEEESLNTLRLEMNIVRLIILLQTIGFLVVVWLTSRLGINPVLKAVDRIKDDDPLPEIGASEFRYLAQAYNKMYEVYKRSLENLNFKASHDELTGAYNRTGYDLLLSSIDRRTTYLLFFDIDKFKEINDQYGHPTGDAVLARFVYVLKKNFRSDDYICRIGGDEFCVFMVHADIKWKNLVTSKIRKIEAELAAGKDDVPAFTVSCGIAHGCQADDIASLVRMADEALYQTKNNGRNGYTFA